MFVVTIDQRGSRSGPDRVPGLLAALDALTVPRAPGARAGAEGAAGARGVVRAFERTAGDEVQGVIAAEHPATALDVVSLVQRAGGWSTGIGAGPVRTPLPASTRAGAGEAFVLARTAVERAKRRHPSVDVAGADPGAAREAAAVLRLLAEVLAQRTPGGWAVVDVLASGATQSRAAEVVGVTKQAVSQRARAAGWALERDVRPVLEGLLVRAAGGAA